MKTNFRKQAQKVVAFLLVWVLAVAPISQVAAAKYTKDNMTLSINNGNSNKKVTIENSIITGTVEDKTVSYSNNTVIFKAIENGVTKSYVLATNVILDKVQKDKNNTVWMRNINGKLDIWNYDLQKSESEVRLHTVTDKSIALVIENELVVGYYIYGSTVILPILSETELKEKIHPTVTQPTVTKKTKYADSVTSRGKYYMELRNSEGKKVDQYKLKNKKLIYKGTKTEKVIYAVFNEKGNLCYITSKLELGVINHKTLKKTLVKSGVKKFHSSKGIGKYAVRKNGTRFSLKKY